MNTAIAALTEEECRTYHKEGFLVVRGLFHPLEIAMISMEADRLLERHKDLMETPNIRCRWQNHVETSECLFETFDPVIDLSPALGTLARDPRLLDVVGEFSGEPVHLFKDKLIYKPPGAKGHDLHQDFISWPNFPTTFITAAVAIDACDRENGCTEVYPRVHQKGYLSPMDGDYHPLAEEHIAGVEAVPLILEPGDVAFFGGYVPHRSAPNRSQSWRRLLYLSYNADSDGGDQRDAHYAEFHTWLKKKYAEYGKTDTYFR